MQRSLRPRDDQGTILLLTIGLSVVLMLLVVVVVDVSVVVLAKRGVANAADGAALAAAQQPDEAAINSGDDALASRLPLDPMLVAQVVATYQLDAAQSQPTLTLTPSVEGPGSSEAVVQAQRTVRLPFVSWFGLGEVVVHATGRARSPVAP